MPCDGGPLGLHLISIASHIQRQPHLSVSVSACLLTQSTQRKVHPPPGAPPSTDNSRDNENKQTKREEEPGGENQTKERSSRRAVPTGGQPLARLSTHHWEGSKRKTNQKQKNLHRSPKKYRNKRTKICVACGRSSLLFKQKKRKEKVVTKDRPQKKKKKTPQHTRARTKKQKTHKEERRSKGRENKSNETTRDAHASARSRTHARTRAREGEKRDRERRSGGVLYWRSEGAEYSATAESTGFQGERERERAPFSIRN